MSGTRSVILFAGGLLLGVVLTFAGLFGWMRYQEYKILARLDRQRALAPSTPTLPTPDTEPTGESSVMPADWSLKSISGDERIEFRSFKGKVVLLHVWATWCTPCIAELPTIVKLARTTPPDAVSVLLIARDDPKAVKKFLESRPALGLPVYVLDGEAPPQLRQPVVPVTFLLDRQGRIVLEHRGAANWASESIRALIRRLNS